MIVLRLMYKRGQYNDNTTFSFNEIHFLNKSDYISVAFRMFNNCKFAFVENYCICTLVLDL